MGRANPHHQFARDDKRIAKSARRSRHTSATLFKYAALIIANFGGVHVGLLKSTKLFMAVCCAATSSFAHAAWNLDPAKSSLNFVSIKKDSIGEVHQFKEIAGRLSETGDFMIDIDLTSVNTGIEIRDQRMQEDFFEIMQFPLAMAQGSINPEVLSSLREGVVTQVTADLSINLHGATAPVTAKLNAVKLSPSTLWVTTESPIIVNTEDFQLSPGIEKLKQLAGLPSISYAVPVVVNLLFNYAESAPAAADETAPQPAQ